MKRALGFALACALGCSTADVASMNPLSNELGIDEERVIGAQAHRQIRAHAPMVTDPIVLEYVNELGQALVEATEPQPFIYHFNVIESDTLNAFAVPGGYIYLHSAVLQQSGDVSELAGVLGHEVAHVRRRHIAEAQKKGAPTQLATLIASLGAIAAGADPAVAALASGVNVALQLKHTREHEADADRHGIEYMIATGYEPEGMVRFFQRIEGASQGGASEIPPYLFSHPAIPDRIHAARAEMDRIHAPVGLTRDDPRLKEIQARLAKLSDRVAGGTGLQARYEFDRRLAEPFLTDARLALAEDQLDAADLILQRGESVSPDDPRLPLARADLAERRGDWETAVQQLGRLVELDPQVAMAQYRLGLAHHRTGDDVKASFHLGIAGLQFAPGSSGQRKADVAAAALSIPVLSATGLSDERGGTERTQFAAGNPVVWWASVGSFYRDLLPRFRAIWRDPDGVVSSRETFPLGSLMRIDATLDTRGARPGTWTLEVFAEDFHLETRTFTIVSGSS